jgi:N-acyl-D-amino-acid deacylase
MSKIGSTGQERGATAVKRCDLLIRNCMVIDGTGSAPFSGDVAVRGGRIAALGDLGTMAANHEMDAAGRVVAPGFIDVHTHDDHALLEGSMTPKVSQGVTTVVAGNCGVSLAPLVFTGELPAPLRLLGETGYRFESFGAYLEALEACPAAVNAALLVGHSTLRVATMSDTSHPASPGEIAAMRGLLREALDSGAAGFSTGLFYPAGRAAPMTEVIALLETLAGTGAVYATHMRDEADGVEESLAESFETARRAGVPLIISHHKCMGRPNFGRSSRTLALIDRARREQSVGLDVYPYTAGSTELLTALIGQASRVIVTWSRPHPELAGRDLADIAATWGVDEAAAVERLQPAGAIYFMMDETDVQRIMSYPHAMIGSDGLPHDEHPHPRLWGTFPRVLGRYVRELGLLTLEDAVHRMTGLPAAQFGLVDRGVLRPGAFADIVVFDAATVADRATFEAPKNPADGIDLVVVNGEIVYRDGQPTGARPGRVLRRGVPSEAQAG